MNSKLPGSSITDKSIIPLVYENYGQYAVDTQTRHIPRIEDFLKLSTRRVIARILNAPTLVKSAKIVGDVLGAYHPHGDSSVYKALVTISSSKAAFPLVQGKGNWGDLRNNRDAAAYRYTECMIHKNLEYTLDDEAMKRAGVFIPNFSGDTTEPYFIMTKIPVGLLNHTKGTIVGLTVNVPSHNINEIIEACIKIIEGDYSISTKALAKIVKGPDHRLYDVEYIVEKNEWLRILETGNGKVTNNPLFTIIDNCAVFSSIPYNSNIESFIETAYKVNDKLMKKYNKRGIVKRVLDISSSEGELAIQVSFLSHTPKDREINTEFLRQLISTLTGNIHYNMQVCEQIENETPSMSDGSTYQVRTIGIKEMLIHHQSRRKEYKLKALFIRLDELKRDLDCEDLKLLIANDSNKFFKIISAAATNKEAIKDIAKAYKKTEEIAERVLNSTFSAFINKQERIRATIERLQREIADTESKIKNIDQYLIDELNALKSKIGRPRKSRVTEVIAIVESPDKI